MFDLETLEGEGALRTTKRANWENLARQGDPEACHVLENQPELPRHAAHVWSYFHALHETRPTGGMSVSRLTRQDIRLWQEDEGITLEPWERRAIFAIDALWVRSVSQPAEG